MADMVSSTNPMPIRPLILTYAHRWLPNDTSFCIPAHLDRNRFQPAVALPREGSLAEALFFLRNGRCSGNAGAEAEVQSRQRRELPRPYAGDGWRQLLGAH